MEPIQKQIFDELVAAGIPPGIALKQSQAMAYNAELPTATGRGSTGGAYGLAQRGTSVLSPAELGALDAAFHNPRAFDSATSADLAAGIAPSVENSRIGGDVRGYGGDIDTSYQAALQAYAEAIRSGVRQRGGYMSLAEAKEAARNYLGDADQFGQRRDILSSLNPQRAANQAELMGYEVPMALAGLTGNHQSTGFIDDFKDTFTSSTRKQVIAAKKNLQGALRTGNKAAITSAYSELLGAQQKAQNIWRGIGGNLIPMATGAFAGYQALGRNDRGDTALENLRRLTGLDPTLDVDSGDFVRAGAAIPAEMAAQAYLFNTLPRNLTNNFWNNPLRAIGRAGFGGQAALSAAEMAPDLAVQLGLGSDRSQAALARRDLALQQKINDDLIRGGPLTAATDFGSLTDIGRRGLFRRWGGMGLSEDEKKSTVMRMLGLLSDGAQTAGDILTAPITAASSLAGLAGKGLEAGAQTLGNVGNAVGLDFLEPLRDTHLLGLPGHIRRTINPAHMSTQRALFRDTAGLKDTIKQYDNKAYDDSTYMAAQRALERSEPGTTAYEAAQRKSDQALSAAKARLRNPDTTAKTQYEEKLRNQVSKTTRDPLHEGF